MSASATHLRRFEAASAELLRLSKLETSATVAKDLETLTQMLIEGIRPGPGRGVTLTGETVAQLETEASSKGDAVRQAFANVLKRALAGTIDLGGYQGPVLLVDQAAQSHLEHLAGLSEVVDRTVRGGLEATAEGEGPKVKTRASNTMLQMEEWRMNGKKGMARGGKTNGASMTETGFIGSGLRNLEGEVRRAKANGQPASVATETLEALSPQIHDAFYKVGADLWSNDRVRLALGKIALDPKNAKALLPALCKDAGSSICTVLGVKLVNEEVVKHGLQLLPSVAKKLGIEGVERAAANIGKVLLKEGTEEVVKAGAKQGVKKGVMGLLSSIPLANVIPMLFTGGEMLAEFTKRPPDKRVLGKGLATFALQVGALAFPPLGLAATAVDLSGSIAIAVADGGKAGLSKDERRQKAGEVLSKHQSRSTEMSDAIASNADLTSQALTAMERSFRELGSGDRADKAKDLAARAKAIGDDEEAAKTLQKEIGSFSFETVLPEIIDQVKKLRDTDSEDRDHWQLMLDGLGKVGASVMGVRTNPSTGETDPERNEPKLKMLISGILEAGIAGTALAKEAKLAAKVTD
jgi:hypothetical protein